MARRREQHEEHANHEAWAIPYGDLVTLLLAFFVVMYAISSVNEGKFRVLADAMSSAFGGPPRTITPIQLGQTQLRGSAFDRPSIQTPDARSGPTSSSPMNAPKVRQMLDMPTFGRKHDTPSEDARAAAGASKLEIEGRKTVQLQTLGQRIQDALAELVRQNLVTVRRGRTFLEVEIQSDILFASGVAQPSPLAVRTVRQLAAILRAEQNAVRVEGYTDDRPIHTTQFRSNWELSAARAGSVVHELVGAGVESSRLAVVGYGEHQPVADNATVAGRNSNRRVMLVILAMPQGPDSEPDRSAPRLARQSDAAAPHADAAPKAVAATADPTPAQTPRAMPDPASDDDAPAPGVARAIDGANASTANHTAPAGAG